jgi:tRNA-specific 2-thiouridylase
VPAYPPEIVRHVARPFGGGLLDDANAVGESGAVGCGDVVRIQLRIADGRVATARFLAYGCPAALAAASVACATLEGVDLSEAMLLSADRLDAALGGLGDARRHGAEITADAVARALEAWFSARLGDVGLPLRSGRVAVAMSGGVDSAVAALLLSEAGRDVVGVTMRLWHDPAAAAAERSCCSPETVRLARASAHALGIPHLTIDAAEPFHKGVVEEFMAGYKAGLTPNPCVVCNGSVRFKVLAQVAALVGAQELATGHYARVVDGANGTPVLAAAADADKDQSYMLSMLGPDILRRLVFPLGELTKPEVRARARAAALPAADAVESQEICFVGAGGYGPFLERNAGLAPEFGPIVDLDGTPIGEHQGYWRFTVGQRKGIGVAAGEPLYVLGTDPERNAVVVGPRSALETWGLELRPAVAHDVLDLDAPFEVRVRYRGAPLPGRTVVPIDESAVMVGLAEPAPGVAPGQTATIYQAGRLVLAGTIAVSHPSSGSQ